MFPVDPDQLHRHLIQTRLLLQIHIHYHQLLEETIAILCAVLRRNTTTPTQTSKIEILFFLNCVFSYFSAARNGFPPPLDPRFKPSTFPNLLPNLQSKDSDNSKKNDFSSLLNPFANNHMFPPLIDMSTTQTLLAMVRTAKEAELQTLLKSVKRQDASSPLDLSAAAPPLKRPRMKTSASSSPSTLSKRAQSESPRLHEDVSSWTVDDVCNFVSSIDICAEYAQVSNKL